MEIYERECRFEFGEHIEVLSNDGITWLHAIYLRPELEEFGIHRVHIKGYSHSSNCNIKQIRKADW